MLTKVIDALPLPALVIGADGHVLASNDLVARLLGFDLFGLHYITALRQPSVLDAIEAAIAGEGATSGRYFGSEARKDTTWDVHARAFEQDGGQAILLTFVDRTAVEEAWQVRRDFVANVSHELRTPLTALLGYVETLQGAARDDAAARERFLTAMLAEAMRMSRLIDDLLSLGRVEEGARLRPMTRVDFAAIVREACESLSTQATAAAVSLELCLPHEPVNIPGDALQLHQLVVNLVENAIKYGASGGTVDVVLGRPEDGSALPSRGVRLQVRDHGEGIAAHHVGRLTERFYRVDSHRSREVGGTGLGLAIVKHIVNRHRGRLKIESEPGKGSVFNVVLPEY